MELVLFFVSFVIISSGYFCLFLLANVEKRVVFFESRVSHQLSEGVPGWDVSDDRLFDNK
jgi:hypothetical protein